MATTPTLLSPIVDATGLYLRDRIAFQWTRYVDAFALLTQAVEVYSDAGGVTRVWTSGAVGLVTGRQWDGGMERFAEDIGDNGLQSITDYWWRVQITDSQPSTSAWTALRQFTMETARVTRTAWREAQ